MAPSLELFNPRGDSSVRSLPDDAPSRQLLWEIFSFKCVKEYYTYGLISFSWAFRLGISFLVSFLASKWEEEATSSICYQKSGSTFLTLPAPLQLMCVMLSKSCSP